MKLKTLKVSALLAVFVFSFGCGNQQENTNNENGAEAQENVVEAKDESHSKGQADVVDEESEPNILQIAVKSPDHTTLVKAVQAAEIEHVIVNAGPLTVFAPVNSAFDALPEGTVEELLKPENKAKLAEILTRHAAPGTFDIEQLKKEAKKGRKIYTATGDYLDVEEKDGEIYVAGAKVLGEVPASNGVVVVIDKVILPEEK